ncbi:hypothetical protein Pint_00451 [Pistacia integerrima]|uniref:Uncharacterized protein n=1 Tax=Pistacia integerrima TaxID=434235 RepID=A0ACC0ZLZ3_9ROSI|nr:hypothetical protein Pint_00451 [Pistacia integerrima]
MKMKNPFPLLPLILLLLVVGWSEAGKAKVHITDDLDDVVDDEEDEAWKEWGKKKPSVPDEFDPPKIDHDTMSLSEIQHEIMSRQYGPVYGFVKLRLGTRRTRETVTEITKKWTKVLKTGGIEVNFMGVDLVTVMFTLQRGLDNLELKEFLLNQPEAYEVKIGDQVFRRPGDPPLDQVIKENLENEENKEVDDATAPKQEL